jgi:hypothetical protein
MMDMETWKGKRIEDLSKEEAIECIRYLAREYRGHTSPEAIKERSVGRVEMMKRGNG